MPDERPLSADDVARRQFATGFRGFEQHEVRAFLAQVAAELASLQERERSLRDRLRAAEERPAPAPVSLDDEAMEAALGAETTRVIHAAREAAAEIRQRAEESVARMVREANAEASRVRHEAETVLAVRTEEAEAAAAGIRSEAVAYAEQVRSEADARAAAVVDEAQQQGKEMVAEAQAVRQRMLADLARRRAKAATQLEQLRAGRERLLEAYEVVRTTLDQATSELGVADAEARAAADAAGLKAPQEIEGLDLPEQDPLPESASAAEAVEAVEPGEVAEVPAGPEPEPMSPAGDVEPRERTGTSGPTLSVVPAPEAEPEAVDEPPSGPRVRPVPVAKATEPGEGEERRTSALRLLRRKADTEPERPGPAGGGDDVEGVRIIRPEAVPTPKPAPVAEPGPAEPVPEAEPGSPADEPAAGSPDPAPEPAPAAAVVEATGEEAAEHDTPVDDIFARLRADRAASVERAEAVLAATAATPAEPEPEATEATADGAGSAAYDAVFEARDAAIETAERALVRSLKRALADEQNEVLDALRRLKGRPSVEALLPEPADQAARYVTAATEHLAAGAAAGAATLGGGEVGTDDLARALGDEVAADLRSRVSRAVDQAGGDAETLQDALSAAYREWKTSRAEPLGRHAVAGAYAAGAFAAAPDVPLTWVVDRAEGGCPDCDDNTLAGPTPKGEVFPTGQTHPPAHAGCRCLVLPATR